MIKNTNAGLKTVHTLIVQCRSEAYECGNIMLAGNLDTAEYLLALIMQKSDETEWFEDFIKGHETVEHNYKSYCEEES